MALADDLKAITAQASSATAAIVHAACSASSAGAASQHVWRAMDASARAILARAAGAARDLRAAAAAVDVEARRVRTQRIPAARRAAVQHLTDTLLPALTAAVQDAVAGGLAVVSVCKEELLKDLEAQLEQQLERELQQQLLLGQQQSWQQRGQLEGVVSGGLGDGSRAAAGAASLMGPARLAAAKIGIICVKLSDTLKSLKIAIKSALHLHLQPQQSSSSQQLPQQQQTQPAGPNLQQPLQQQRPPPPHAKLRHPQQQQRPLARLLRPRIRQRSPQDVRQRLQHLAQTVALLREASAAPAAAPTALTDGAASASAATVHCGGPYRPRLSPLPEADTPVVDEEEGEDEDEEYGVGYLEEEEGEVAGPVAAALTAAALEPAAAAAAAVDGMYAPGTAVTAVSAAADTNMHQERHASGSAAARPAVKEELPAFLGHQVLGRNRTAAAVPPGPVCYSYYPNRHSHPCGCCHQAARLQPANRHPTKAPTTTTTSSMGPAAWGAALSRTAGGVAAAAGSKVKNFAAAASGKAPVRASAATSAAGAAASRSTAVPARQQATYKQAAAATSAAVERIKSLARASGSAGAGVLLRSGTQQPRQQRQQQQQRSRKASGRSPPVDPSRRPIPYPAHRTVTMAVQPRHQQLPQRRPSQQQQQQPLPLPVLTPVQSRRPAAAEPPASLQPRSLSFPEPAAATAAPAAPHHTCQLQPGPMTSRSRASETAVPSSLALPPSANPSAFGPGSGWLPMRHTRSASWAAAARPEPPPAAAAAAANAAASAVAWQQGERLGRRPLQAGFEVGGSNGFGVYAVGNEAGYGMHEQQQRVVAEMAQLVVPQQQELDDSMCFGSGEVVWGDAPDLKPPVAGRMQGSLAGGPTGWECPEPAVDVGVMAENGAEELQQQEAWQQQQQQEAWQQQQQQEEAWQQQQQEAWQQQEEEHFGVPLVHAFEGADGFRASELAAAAAASVKPGRVTSSHGSSPRELSATSSLLTFHGPRDLRPLLDDSPEPPSPAVHPSAPSSRHSSSRRSSCMGGIAWGGQLAPEEEEEEVEGPAVGFGYGFHAAVPAAYEATAAAAAVAVCSRENPDSDVFGEPCTPRSCLADDEGGEGACADGSAEYPAAMRPLFWTALPARHGADSQGHPGAPDWLAAAPLHLSWDEATQQAHVAHPHPHQSLLEPQQPRPSSEQLQQPYLDPQQPQAQHSFTKHASWHATPGPIYDTPLPGRCMYGDNGVAAVHESAAAVAAFAAATAAVPSSSGGNDALFATPSAAARRPHWRARRLGSAGNNKSAFGVGFGAEPGGFGSPLPGLKPGAALGTAAFGSPTAAPDEATDAAFDGGFGASSRRRLHHHRNSNNTSGSSRSNSERSGGEPPLVRGGFGGVNRPAAGSYPHDDSQQPHQPPHAPHSPLLPLPPASASPHPSTSPRTTAGAGGFFGDRALVVFSSCRISDPSPSPSSSYRASPCSSRPASGGRLLPLPAAATSPDLPEPAFTKAAAAAAAAAAHASEHGRLEARSRRNRLAKTQIPHHHQQSSLLLQPQHGGGSGASSARPSPTAAAAAAAGGPSRGSSSGGSFPA
ncbi:hypothetical protein Agub_g8130, partial [Astrephomene gubernaculifera]